MGHKVMQVALDQLRPSSEQVMKEAQALISAAQDARQIQAEFLSGAGVNPDELGALLNSQPSSEGARQALAVWEAELRDDLARARDEMVGVIRTARLRTRSGRTAASLSSTSQRCTRIF